MESQSEGEKERQGIIQRFKKKEEGNDSASLRFTYPSADGMGDVRLPHESKYRGPYPGARSRDFLLFRILGWGVMVSPALPL